MVLSKNSVDSRMVVIALRAVDRNYLLTLEVTLDSLTNLNEFVLY